MDNSVQVTEEEKNNIYNALSEALIQGLETGIITMNDSQISSKYILEGLEKLATHNEVVSFLEDVSNRWPAYKSVYLSLKEQQNQQLDNHQIEATREQLQRATK